MISEKIQELGKSADMQAGFQSIARILINHWTMRIFRSIVSNRAYPVTDILDLAAGSMEETFKHGKHLRTLPEPLRAFIKHASKRSLILRAQRKTDTINGQYNPGAQPIITLCFDQDMFETTREAISAGNSWEIHNLLSTRTNTLVHELIHVYDDFASNGQYTTAAKNGIIASLRPYGAPPPTEEEKLAAHNRYLQFPHEVNARFGQTVAMLNTHFYSTWQDYVYQFKTTFYGWRLIPPETQRRLLVRLGMLWSAEQKKKAIDIKPFVEKLNLRLRELYGNELRVMASHGDIEIDWLTRIPPKAQSMALQKVCRLADIFQRQVTTDENVALLRGFGFVANKGRNKDYRISARFRRPANIRN